MKGTVMIGAGIAVGLFGLLFAIFHSFVFLSLAVFSFIFFFVALFSKESLPVLIGFTIGAAIALGIGTFLLPPHNSPEIPAAAEEEEECMAAISADDADGTPLVSQEIAVPDPPEIFSLIKVEGVRYYKPTPPEMFSIITYIDWE